jgi:hypothetical protein
MWAAVSRSCHQAHMHGGRWVCCASRTLVWNRYVGLGSRGQPRKLSMALADAQLSRRPYACHEPLTAALVVPLLCVRAAALYHDVHACS